MTWFQWKTSRSIMWWGEARKCESGANNSQSVLLMLLTMKVRKFKLLPDHVAFVYIHDKSVLDFSDKAEQQPYPVPFIPERICLKLSRTMEFLRYTIPQNQRETSLYISYSVSKLLDQRAI